VELLTVIECQSEADTRMGKGHPLDDINDLAALGPHGSYILQPGRCVEEQFTDGYIRPLAFFSGPLLLQLPALNPDGDRFSVQVLCFHLHFGDSADTRQRLAAESERADLEKIVIIAYLARGMPLEQKRDIRLMDALAVIYDSDQLHAGFFDEHFNFIRICIKGVLNQLLDDGARTLHHFTRGYFVLYFWIKHSDRRHLITRLSICFSSRSVSAAHPSASDCLYPSVSAYRQPDDPHMIRYHQAPVPTAGLALLCRSQ